MTNKRDVLEGLRQRREEMGVENPPLTPDEIFEAKPKLHCTRCGRGFSKEPPMMHCPACGVHVVYSKPRRKRPKKESSLDEVSWGPEDPDDAWARGKKRAFDPSHKDEPAPTAPTAPTVREPYDAYAVDDTEMGKPDDVDHGHAIWWSQPDHPYAMRSPDGRWDIYHAESMRTGTNIELIDNHDQHGKVDLSIDPESPDAYYEILQWTRDRGFDIQIVEEMLDEWVGNHELADPDH